MIPYGEDYQDSGRWTDRDGTVHDDGTGPAPVLVRLADVTPERVSWLWPGRLPAAKIVVLDGDPDMGKTTLSGEFAAHLSTGRKWPDGSTCPLGNVVILSAEDGLADTIRPRLDAAGGDPARVHALTAVRVVSESGKEIDRPPTLADIDVIRLTLKRTRARLLIVDVLMAYLPSGVDSHRDQDVRGVLHRLAVLAEETGCTVLLLRHLNKTGANNPLYRGGGSIGISGAARAGLLVAPDPDDDDQRVLAVVKSNLAAKPSSLAFRLEKAPPGDVARVVWAGDSTHSARDLLVDDSGERTETDDAASFIFDYLTNNGGSALAREVQAAGRKHGYSKTTMHRAAKRLGVQGEKEGMRGPWRWRHPDDRPRKEEPEPPGKEEPEPEEREPEPGRGRGDGAGDGRRDRAEAAEDSTEDSEDSNSQTTESSESSWNLREPEPPRPRVLGRWLVSGGPLYGRGPLASEPAPAAVEVPLTGGCQLCGDLPAVTFEGEGRFCAEHNPLLNGAA